MQTNLLRVVTIATLLVGLPSLASAAPGIPEQFYGTVQYDSGTTPTGLTVNALINGVIVATSTTQSGGAYGASPNLLIVADDGGNLSGQTVTFAVNGITARETSAFSNAALTNLNLTVAGAASGSTTSTPPSSGDGSSGGNGGGGGGNGGGGGGSSIPSVTTTPPTSTTPAPAPVTIAPTSVPTSSQGRVLGAASYHFTKNLSVGSRGDEVTALQQFLSDNGFLAGSPTGYFGGLTKAAVIAFQKSHGISPLGSVGPLTRTELNKGVTTNTSDVIPATNRSSLTASQVNAIMGLLQAFGADASVIANVKASL